jgi:hypothetical protein
VTKAPTRQATGKKKPVTAADVGRYLRSLALLNRDATFGNPHLSEALGKLGKALIEQKAAPFDAVAGAVVHEQLPELFPDDAVWAKLSLDDVKRRLRRPTITKSEMQLIGIKRFGIAKSRLSKLPMDQVAAAVEAAIQHEESLAIISEEAKRGGYQRSS